MQNLCRKILERLHRLHPLSRMSMKLGAALMLVFYIIALAAKLYVPYTAKYFEALALYRGCLEAAPAFLAVGVVAGLLGDLVLRSGSADDDSHPND